uniref:histidine kinase n=1 Tax=Neobacillus citreus TaxID=2833578 RepID=A0A942SX32_9BACI
MMAVSNGRLWGAARVWEGALDGALVLTLVVEIARVMSGAGDLAEGLLASSGCVTASLRRVAPISVMGVLGVLSGLGALLEPTNMVGVWVAAQVVLFSVALRRSRRVAVVSAALLASIMYAIVVMVEGLPWLDPTALVVLVWTAAVVGAALTLRAQHETVEAETQRVVSIQEAQESLIARRLTEERIRIARDLHDSVAHGISAIALQTSAIDAALDNPALVRERLWDIRSTARAVLGETQQILQLLRQGEDPAVTVDIETVLEDARAARDDIDAVLDPLLMTEPVIVRVSLASILREALTNARRHGRGPVTVRTVVEREMIRLVVVNKVSGRRLTASPSGFGLRGVRERAEALGGEMELRRAEDEFTLTVRLPRTSQVGHG